MSLPPRAHPRENRTRYVVLGMLTLCPMNGYALRKAIAESVGHFWQESFGQLYPALRALAAEGLVRPLPAAARPAVATADRRGGAAYEITARGRDALLGWLALPPAPDVVRSELLLKVFFGRTVPRGAFLASLRPIAAAAQAQLAGLEALAARLDAVPEAERGGPFPRLTLDFGVRYSRLVLGWLADVERAARGQADPIPRSPGPTPQPPVLSGRRRRAASTRER